MTHLLRIWWAFVKRDAAIEMSYRAAMVAQLGEVLFWLIFFAAASQLVGSAANGLLARYGGSYVNFALLGIAFGGYLQSGLISYPQRLREAQLAGTLEAMVMSPASPVQFVAALGLWDHVVTTGRLMVYLWSATLFFGLDLRHANIAGALVILVFAIIAFDALGLASAALVLVVQRGVSLAPLLATVAGLLSGVYFPVEALPSGVQMLSLLLPSTYALAGVRLALLSNASWIELIPSIGALVVFDLLLIPLGILLVHWAMRRALFEGTLSHY